MRGMVAALRFLCAALLAMPSFGLAQDGSAPLIETELEATEAVPGQPVTFRVTVLVPTWLARPVEFPSFEAPDLMVKLFEKSTTPVSRTVSGDTWSGVTRVYRLSPMVAGAIPIPAQELAVFWAEPGNPDPNSTTLQTQAFTLRGIMPEGAEDLSPFIAASDLTLNEEISSDSRVLKPGDSLTRTITISITGASPFMLPQVQEVASITGLAAYPAEPALAERVEGDWLSGTRTESVTWVAESGGSGAVPPVTLRWFNLQTGEIETVRSEGFDLSVDAPVARTRPDLDGAAMARLVGIAVASMSGLYLIYRFAMPPVLSVLRARKEARLASADHAFHGVRRAIRGRNYGHLAEALGQWNARVVQMDLMTDCDLRNALMALGAALHGAQPSDAAREWSALDHAVVQVRTRVRTSHKSLAYNNVPLNPVN